MDGNQSPFAELVSIKRPPLFCGMKYPFGKVQLNVFMESINRYIWQMVVNGYTISSQVVEDKTIEKPFESWSHEEIKKVKSDSKVVSIIQSSLNCDEFSRVLTCSMCHTLISSGNLCTMTCDHSLVLVRCLAPIIRQFMTFQDMPKNQK